MCLLIIARAGQHSGKAETSCVKVVPCSPMSALTWGMTSSDANVWPSVRIMRTLGGGSEGSVAAL